MKASDTAIVLIEFQNEFCKSGGKLYELVKDEMARQDTIAHAVELAEKARQKGCLVIHCPFVYDEPWAREHGVCGIIADAAEKGAFAPGQWGTQFIDELTPVEGDEVLSGKHALSGFANTSLHEILKTNGVKNVVIAGFLSNVCVEGTARSAYDLGYRVRVIRDAVAAESQANQEYVEREIYPLLGESVTTDQFIEALD
ncbi:MAG: cysteine hydrolase [Phycisphaerae bacterium]|jgi:nicotinamidase-related amidase|nr:cysteine hydrolase [Phycisphaerae bacterium]